MRYKNMSRMTKTFHGVVFEPGSIHNVDGYINDTQFVRVENEIAEVSVDTVTEIKRSKKSKGADTNGTDCN